jgi:hypothetical protein
MRNHGITQLLTFNGGGVAVSMTAVCEIGNRGTNETFLDLGIAP